MLRLKSHCRYADIRNVLRVWAYLSGLFQGPSSIRKSFGSDPRRRAVGLLLVALTAVSYIAVTSSLHRAAATKTQAVDVVANMALRPEQVAGPSRIAPDSDTNAFTVAAALAKPAVAPTTTTPKPAAPTTTTQRPAVTPPSTAAAPVATTAAPATAPTYAYGCVAAIAYLDTHAAPGYRIVCPGYAEGREAMTCNNAWPCPGEKEIVIADPCPVAYRNEASNSRVFAGLSDAPIDPFGAC